MVCSSDSERREELYREHTISAIVSNVYSKYVGFVRVILKAEKNCIENTPFDSSISIQNLF